MRLILFIIRKMRTNFYLGNQTYLKLKNGLKLIEESLTFYEKRIKDKIELIFTIDKIPLLNLPKDIFKNSIETFLSVEKFIEETKTTCIGIPLFIAHGDEISPNKILEELKKLERSKFLGLDTKYYVISMPISDASKEKSQIIQLNNLIFT